jgi:hypothetical protein
MAILHIGVPDADHIVGDVLIETDLETHSGVPTAMVRELAPLAFCGTIGG